MLQRLTTWLLLLLPLAATAQEGNFLISNFSPANRSLDNSNVVITHDSRGQMVFANRKGVLKFDGQLWYIVQTPTTPHILKYDSSSTTLFVGCSKSFGYISASFGAEEKYVAIAADSTGASFSEPLQIEVYNGYLYVLTYNKLLIFKVADKQLVKQLVMAGSSPILSIIPLNKGILAVNEEGENYELSEKGVGRKTFHTFATNELPIFSTLLDSGQTLVGTTTNNLYLFEKGGISQVQLNDEEYVRDGELLDAVALDDKIVFLATQRSGCLLVDLTNGTTIGFVNYQTGLPDDEILTIGKGPGGGVWVAHEYGISRVDFQLPFRDYTYYPGLRGNLTSAINFEGKLYVGTSVGLFKLDQVKNYEEVERLVRIEREVQQDSQGQQTKNRNQGQQQNQRTLKSIGESLGSIFKTDEKEEEEELQVQTANDKKKKRIRLKGLFKKKKKNGEEEDGQLEADTSEVENEAEPTSEPAKRVAAKKSPVNEPKKAVKFVKQTELSLKSIGHVYRKVEEVKGKVVQLSQIADRLVVATNQGLFEIHQGIISQISNHSVDYMYKPGFSNRFYVSTHSNGLYRYAIEEDEGSWATTKLLSPTKDYVQHVIEDAKGTLWLSTTSAIYKIPEAAKGKQQGTVKSIHLDNPYSDEVHLATYKGKVYFALSSGLYYINDNLRVKRDTALEKTHNFEGVVLSSQKERLWVYNGRTWEALKEQNDNSQTLPLLGLFNNIRHLLVDDFDQLAWVITESGNLYQLDLSAPVQNNQEGKVFFRDIKGDRDKLLNANNFELDQHKSTLNIRFAKADYLGASTAEYQYLLKRNGDPDKKWSDWIREDNVSFNYLPSGEYTFLVRHRDAIGTVSKSEEIKFSVNPPWWETPWFYGLEILLFSTLLLLSFRLNRSKRSNRMLSRGLTYLTLILIAALMETVLESYINIESNPFYDFLTQAALALLIFPFERILSLVMRKGTPFQDFSFLRESPAEQSQQQPGVPENTTG